MLSTDASAKHSNTAITSLLKCPYYELPIVPAHIPSDNEAELGAASAVSPVDISLPLVLRSPESEQARTLSALVDDITRGILRTEIEAQLSPTVTHLKGRGILLR